MARKSMNFATPGTLDANKVIYHDSDVESTLDSIIDDNEWKPLETYSENGITLSGFHNGNFMIMGTSINGLNIKNVNGWVRVAPMPVPDGYEVIESGIATTCLNVADHNVAMYTAAGPGWKGTDIDGNQIIPGHLYVNLYGAGAVGNKTFRGSVIVPIKKIS